MIFILIFIYKMSIINFDEASNAWRKNKRYIGNGYFLYKCMYIHSNGKRCNRIIESQKLKPKYNIIQAWDYEQHNNSDESDIFCKQHKHRSAYNLSWS